MGGSAPPAGWLLHDRGACRDLVHLVGWTEHFSQLHGVSSTLSRAASAERGGTRPQDHDERTTSAHGARGGRTTAVVPRNGAAVAAPGEAAWLPPGGHKARLPRARE